MVYLFGGAAPLVGFILLSGTFQSLWKANAQEPEQNMEGSIEENIEESIEENIEETIEESHSYENDGDNESESYESRPETQARIKKLDDNFLALGHKLSKYCSDGTSKLIHGENHEVREAFESIFKALDADVKIAKNCFCGSTGCLANAGDASDHQKKFLYLFQNTDYNVHEIRKKVGFLN